MVKSQVKRIGESSGHFFIFFQTSEDLSQFCSGELFPTRGPVHEFMHHCYPLASPVGWVKLALRHPPELLLYRIPLFSDLLYPLLYSLYFLNEFSFLFYLRECQVLLLEYLLNNLVAI